MRAFVVAAILAALGGCKSGSSTPAVIKEGVRIVYQVDAGADPAALARTAEVITKRLAIAKLAGRAAVQNTTEISTVAVDLATRDPELIEQARAIASASGRFELALVANADPVSLAYYRRVQGDAGAGAAPDPAASAVGITAEVDSWNADGSAIQSDYYLTATDSPTTTGRQLLERYLAAVSAADHAFAIPAGRALHFESREPEPGATGARWRTYLADPTGHITGDHIAVAALVPDPAAPDRQTVVIDLDAVGKAAFAALTSAHIGKKVVVILDDRVHSAPIISGPIPGGRLTISLAEDNPAQAADAATQLVAILGGGALPAPVVEVSFMQLANGEVVPPPP